MLLTQVVEGATQQHGVGLQEGKQMKWLPSVLGAFCVLGKHSHGAIPTALRHIPHLVSELLCLKCAFLLSSFQTYEELRVPQSGMKFTDGKAPLISQAEGPWLVVFLGPSQKGRLGEGRDM